MAEQPAGAGPDELEDVGVLLLGHEAARRGDGVVEDEVPELPAGEDDEILGGPAQVEEEEGEC
jgi:hypothetical protein